MMDPGRLTRDQEVYILRADRGEDMDRSDACLWKVGRSRNCEVRMSELQTGCPYPLSFYGATIIDPVGVCPLDYERAVHKALASYARRGEWFECTSDQLFNAWIRAWSGMTYERNACTPYMDAYVRAYMQQRRELMRKKREQT